MLSSSKSSAKRGDGVMITLPIVSMLSIERAVLDAANLTTVTYGGQATNFLPRQRNVLGMYLPTSARCCAVRLERLDGQLSSFLAMKDWKRVDRSEAARLIQMKRVDVRACHGERDRLEASPVKC